MNTKQLTKPSDYANAPKGTAARDTKTPYSRQWVKLGDNRWRTINDRTATDNEMTLIATAHEITHTPTK